MNEFDKLTQAGKSAIQAEIKAAYDRGFTAGRKKQGELNKETIQEIHDAVYAAGVKAGRLTGIDEYHNEMRDMILGDEELVDWQKVEILDCNDIVAEQLKEQKNEKY